MANQTTVKVDDLKKRASVGVGAFVGELPLNIDATVTLEAWLNVFDVTGGGNVTVNIRTSFKEDADLNTPADWHVIGTFTAIAVTGFATPLVFRRGTAPLGKRLSVQGSVATAAVEFEVKSVLKETL